MKPRAPAPSSESAADAVHATGATEATVRADAPDSAGAPGVQPVGWYGPRDDRRDPYLDPSLPAALLAHARRTCLLIGADAIATRGATVRLHHERYGSYHGLCADEPFRGQPTVLERRPESTGTHGYTGYLLDAERVLTCWHGWEYFAHAPQCALFDYALAAPDADPTWLPADRVYDLAPYPVASPRTPGAPDPCLGDWVVLRLERPVTHLQGLLEGPVSLRKDRPRDLDLPRLARARTGRSVYALGYPRGLPLKLVDGARVLASEAGRFRADLDTYVGNSGSPVFDAASHALLGIVSEAQPGQGDFEPVPAAGCYRSRQVTTPVRGQLAIAASCFDAAIRG